MQIKFKYWVDNTNVILNNKKLIYYIGFGLYLNHLDSNRTFKKYLQNIYIIYIIYIIRNFKTQFPICKIRIQIFYLFALEIKKEYT